MRFRPLVLCYHAVSDRWTDSLSVGASTLPRQIRWLLRRRWRAVSAEDILSNRRHTFHVTFDDAFRNIEAALPALESLAVPVTVFVCPDFADRPRALDVPELRDRAAHAGHELETMGWDALRDLAQRGTEVGSHTLSHVHLTTLSDFDLRRELTESAERVESELGRPCRFLAYPYGENDVRVRAAARAAGYLAAFTLGQPRGPLDPFALARIGIYRRDGLARFTLKSSIAGVPAMKLAAHLRAQRGP